MDDEHKGSRLPGGAEGRPTTEDAPEVVTGGRRRAPRWSLAGIAAAAVLAVPGGMAISSAFAADGGGASSSSSPSSQATPVQSEGTAPQQRGDGDRGDCPGKDGAESGGGGESGTTSTGASMQ
jgi:hypothetical protein